jgi:hypothetical protein
VALSPLSRWARVRSRGCAARANGLLKTTDAPRDQVLSDQRLPGRTTADATATRCESIPYPSGHPEIAPVPLIHRAALFDSPRLRCRGPELSAALPSLGAYQLLYRPFDTTHHVFILYTADMAAAQGCVCFDPF